MNASTVDSDTSHSDTIHSDTANSDTANSESVNDSDPIEDSGSRPYATAGRPPLRRAYQGRMLGGVAAGIADYLGVDVIIVRIAFVVFTALGGAGIPAYLACLFLIPEEGSDVSLATSLLDSIQSR
jgi:phage shock protein PspC (stress-responsive transcriptional regulator)